MSARRTALRRILAAVFCCAVVALPSAAGATTPADHAGHIVAGPGGPAPLLVTIVVGGALVILGGLLTWGLTRRRRG